MALVSAQQRISAPMIGAAEPAAHPAISENGRFSILDPEERRRIQSAYFPWVGLDLRMDHDAPFRAEFGLAMLPAGHVIVSSDSHTATIGRRDEQSRFSFVFVQQGGATLRETQAKSGECLITRHYEGQKWTFSRGRRLLFTIDEGAISEFVRQHYGVDAPKNLRFAETARFDGTALSDLVPIIETMVDSPTWAHAGRDSVRTRFQEMLIAYVIGHVSHNIKIPLRRAESPLVHRSARLARDFIHANLERPITLADMASAGRCSPRQLQLTFKDCFGTSPIAMLRALRLEAAAARLVEGKCESVTDVALCFGYSNFGRFATEFRRRFGCTPSELLRYGPNTQGWRGIR